MFTFNNDLYLLSSMFVFYYLENFVCMNHIWFICTRIFVYFIGVWKSSRYTSHGLSVF